MGVEPTDVGPKYGGHLMVTQADREQAIEVLDAAHATGYLTPAEYTERALAVRSATSFDDLRPVTRDLVNVSLSPSTAPATLPAPVAPAAPVPAVAPLTRVGFFSGSTLAGRWTAPTTMRLFAVFGGVDLDFTDAEWTSDEILVEAYAVFGGVTIKVPDGVEVFDSSVAVFGGTTVTRTTPGARRVVVKGLAMFGGIEVKGPKAKSSKVAPPLAAGGHQGESVQERRQERRDAQQERREARQERRS